MEHVSDERRYVGADRPSVSDERVHGGDRPFVGYAQPLSRLQVSWGAVLAGAVTTLAVSAILWLLALAIVLTATHMTFDSFAGSTIALWIVAIGTTLIGAFIGGMVAGYLPGNARRSVTIAHGFLSWCVAFLVAAFFQIAMVGAITRTTTNALITTTGAAMQTAGGAVGGQATLSQKATNVLQSLGYPPAEASRMVKNTQADIQRSLHGGAATGATAATQARSVGNTILDALALYTWLWWGTWFVSAFLSILGAAIMVGRVRHVPEHERDVEYEYEHEHRHVPFGAEPVRHHP
jgi:hypothetical protein